MTNPNEDNIAAALEALRTAVASELDHTRATAKRELIAALNNAARRLGKAESPEEWSRILEEAGTFFCRQAKFFALSDGTLAVEGAAVPVSSAPAIASVLESKDTVIAAATANELSAEVLSTIGDANRIWLVPVLVRDRIAGVLCGTPDGDGYDVSALELLASLASATAAAVLEPIVQSKTADLIMISALPTPAAARPTARPGWNDLAPGEQAVHLRAQRFARSLVAELLLHKPELVKKGRASSNLYDTLREEIDEGRDAFRRQFSESCPSMVDYLHLELVRTLALDDSRILGSDYPGPLQ